MPNFAAAEEDFPDRVQVDIPTTFNVNEPTKMNITVIKDDKVYTDYAGFIQIQLKDADGEEVDEDDYTITNYGSYSFQAKDRGVFPGELTIVRAGNYTMEVSDVVNDLQLANISFTVVDETLKTEVKKIDFLIPQNETTLNSMIISYTASCPDLPNSLWYPIINGEKGAPFTSSSDGTINGNVALEEGPNTLKLIIEKQGVTVGESDEILINFEDTETEEINDHIESFEIFSYTGILEEVPEEWEHEFTYGDNLYFKLRLKDGYLYSSLLMLELHPAEGVPLNVEMNQDADDPNFFRSTLDNFGFTGDFSVSLSLTYDANSREQTEKHDNYYYFVVRDLPPEPEKELIEPQLKMNPLEGVYYGDSVEFRATVDPSIEEVSLMFNDVYSISMEKTTVPGEFYRKSQVLVDGEVYMTLNATWENKDKTQHVEKILHYIVTKVTVGNVTFKLNEMSGSLTVDWEVLGDTDEFRVFYGLSGESLDNSIDVTGHTVVFENLDVTQEYQFQIIPLIGNVEEHKAATDIYVYRPPYTPKINTGTYSPNVITEHGYACVVKGIRVRTEQIGKSHYLVRDPVPNAVSYIVYAMDMTSATSKKKLLETTDTKYEYPFDYTAEKEIYSYFWVEAVCSDNSVVPLSEAQRVQVWPTENILLVFLVSLLIYAGIRLYRFSE